MAIAETNSITGLTKIVKDGRGDQKFCVNETL
jgi:hypothetical protein